MSVDEDPLATFKWKHNLAFVWVSQFLSIMGLTFVGPFLPFYLEDLGADTQDAVNLYLAMFHAALPLTLAISAPIWGMLADRYGRRIMMLRANAAGFLTLLLMAFAPNPMTLVILRLVQGLFTGTIPAAQSLVAASTPDENQGQAIGMLSTSVFSGFIAASMLGGFCGDILPYRTCYLIAGIMMLMAMLIILFFVSEPDLAPLSLSTPRSQLSWPKYAALPLLGVLLVMQAAKFTAIPAVPLLVRDLHGMVDGASFRTGIANATLSIGAILAGLLAARLSNRYRPAKLGFVFALLCYLSILLSGLAFSLPSLYVFRFMLGFGVGGLDPVLTAWLSRRTPSHERGTVFGWAVTARSIGWVAASGFFYFFSSLSDSYRPVFFGASFFYLIIAFALTHMGRTVQRRSHIQGVDPASDATA